MTYPNDPNFRDPNFRRDMQYEDPDYRREFEREADREGMSTTAWAGIAFVLLLFGEIAVWAYSSSDRSTTASVNRPGVEQTMPPATTGQGGAQSKMPAAKDKDLQ